MTVHQGHVQDIVVRTSSCHEYAVHAHKLTNPLGEIIESLPGFELSTVSNPN